MVLGAHQQGKQDTFLHGQETVWEDALRGQTSRPSQEGGG
jgi:hypothetical protein